MIGQHVQTLYGRQIENKITFIPTICFRASYYKVDLNKPYVWFIIRLRGPTESATALQVYFM